MSTLRDKAVIVLYCKATGLTKISTGFKPFEQAKALTTSMGVQVDVCEHTYLLENYVEIIKFMHMIFEEHRTYGNWFRIDPVVAVTTLEMLPWVESCVHTALFTGMTCEELVDTVKTRVYNSDARGLLERINATDWKQSLSGRHLKMFGVKERPNINNPIGNKHKDYQFMKERPAGGFSTFNRNGARYVVTDDKVVFEINGDNFQLLNFDEYIRDNKEKVRNYHNPES